MAESTIEVTGQAAADPLAAIEYCYTQGWTDGLPVVPPTEARVAEFLAYLGRERDDVLGRVPERRRTVTVEQVVANAVMAGCLPTYGPVVVAAVEAMLQPAFNLVGPSASLGGSAIMTIVNGPIAETLQINSRNNLFGAGNRANATIGRAVRLVLMNTCGAIPGLFDRTTRSARATRSRPAAAIAAVSVDLTPWMNSRVRTPEDDSSYTTSGTRIPSIGSSTLVRRRAL
jgi:hypothetical protein